MPKREDEHYVKQKEATGKPLCPFDGSPNVYYNKHYKVWRCAKCERSFPSPSYGSGHKLPWWRRLFRRT
ncbi:MAG: hypothetical protein HYX81_03550 [Chloroflexi bacterium]|nr:hypothetical protein [Chloroflexota bacterium]